MNQGTVNGVPFVMLLNEALNQAFCVESLMEEKGDVCIKEEEIWLLNYISEIK